MGPNRNESATRQVRSAVCPTTVSDAAVLGGGLLGLFGLGRLSGLRGLLLFLQALLLGLALLLGGVCRTVGGAVGVLLRRAAAVVSGIVRAYATN